MNKYVLGMLLIISFNGFSQNANTTPCANNPQCRVFDFWIGEWEVIGKNNQIAGKSLIQISLDSCLIIENWIGSGGGTGKSFNFYNAANGYWQQTWVDNSGGVIEFIEGKFEDNYLKFATSRPTVNGSIQRLTFFKINDNQVRQLGESSSDQGKTWTTGYDLMYFRK